MVRALWQYIFLLLLAGLTQGAPVDAGVEDGTVPPTVTPEEFANLKGTYFIKFYSPMCGHCKALAPKWDGAYRDVGGSETKGFKWANVNCLLYSDFCSEMAIGSYPTLRIYRDAQLVYGFSNSSPSQLDLRSFAEKYMSIGDQAFTSEYELASKEATDMQVAVEDNEKLAKEADTARKEAETASLKEQEKAVQQPEAPQTQQQEQASGPPSDPAPQHQQEHQSDSQPQAQPAEAAAAPADSQDSPKLDTFQSTDKVTALHGGDFGPDKNVGRWFVLFTGPDCDECNSLAQKWEKHDNFARSIDGINWGRVDCAAEEALCDLESVHSVPAIRLYQDGVQAFKYDGEHNTMALRNFLLHAAGANNFENFNLADLDTPASSSNPDSHLEGARPNQEPNYLTGPVVSRPNYGDKKPKISEVVKYTLDTLGQPIDEDPGKLIFGSSPEAHHNFRTWGAPDAPPPPFSKPGTASSYSLGRVKELVGDEFDKLVKLGEEPWMIKFYSPKCPHCTSMAAAFEDLALQLKGVLNVAAVNCDTDKDVCKSEGVRHWPYIVLYRGSVAMEPFSGKRTAADMLEYSKKAWEAQIHPIENENELSMSIFANLDKNISTFLYLYDESVMSEDWESLQKVATNIDKWGGKLYRSKSTQLRELAGITHRGTAFINVDLQGKPGEGSLKWYDFPWSNIPKKIRDADEVSKWAYRAKWSLLQYLDPIQQTRFSPYIAVLLTQGDKPPSADENIQKHHAQALKMREFYIKRQIEDQDNLRIDRLRQHDKALLERKYKHARHLMRQNIETPVRDDLAFAYIPHQLWVEQYSKYVDVTKHSVGNVIVLDFFNGVYLDEFNMVPIRDERGVLDDVLELLRRYQVKDPKTTFKSIRHFKKSMAGVPEPEHRPMHFHSKPYDSTGTLFSKIPTFLKVVFVLAAIYLVYIKLIRHRLRAFANRNRLRRARLLTTEVK